jgi:hypothetical protein
LLPGSACVQVREARGRRRRRWARTGSGSQRWPKRSIRMTGRMMTIAESAFCPVDLPVRAPRRTPGNFNTVPIAFPCPDRPTDARAGKRNRAPQG